MHLHQWKRREFITVLGGAAAWPVAARGQQIERMRRIGVLMGIANDAEGQSRVAAFRQALQALGWHEGSKVEFSYRWQAASSEQARRFADEMLEWRPDVITQQLDADDPGDQQGHPHGPNCICERG